ncbi:MAG: YCF48-related protein [Acidobacteriota bacterium]
MRKRITLLSLLIVILFTAANCKQQPTQNSNQQNQPTARAGRWVAQWRSPAAKGVQGLYLAAYTYTCLAVLSTKVVYAAGDVPKQPDTRVGIFTRTTDGGATWTENEITRPDMSILGINAMSFVSESTGWLVGLNSKNEGVVLKTTDGGVNWDAMKLPIKLTPKAVGFIDENNGWIGGTSLTPEDEEEENEDDKKLVDSDPSDLLATTDGGKTWQSVRRLAFSVGDIYFLDKTTGWLAGQKGSIYKTTDAGRSWDAQKSELEPGEGAQLDILGEGSKKFRIIGVQFPDAENGFAAAISGDNTEGRILATNNGGATWTKRHIGKSFGFKDVYFANGKTGWCLGDYGHYIYYTVDGGERWLSETTAFEQDIPFFRIQGADEKHVWVAAGGAIFFRTEN